MIGQKPQPRLRISAFRASAQHLVQLGSQRVFGLAYQVVVFDPGLGHKFSQLRQDGRFHPGCCDDDHRIDAHGAMDGRGKNVGRNLCGVFEQEDPGDVVLSQELGGFLAESTTFAF